MKPTIILALSVAAFLSALFSLWPDEPRSSFFLPYQSNGTEFRAADDDAGALARESAMGLAAKMPSDSVQEGR